MQGTFRRLRLTILLGLTVFVVLISLAYVLGLLA
jgi:hypothetical protein